MVFICWQSNSGGGGDDGVGDGFDGGDCVLEPVIDLTFAESAHALINYPIS